MDRFLKNRVKTKSPDSSRALSLITTVLMSEFYIFTTRLITSGLS